MFLKSFSVQHEYSVLLTDSESMITYNFGYWKIAPSQDNKAVSV